MFDLYLNVLTGEVLRSSKQAHPNVFIATHQIKIQEFKVSEQNSLQKGGMSPQRVKGSPTICVMGVEIRLLSAVKLTQP